MKVIVAGYNKTGTKSLHAAFSYLGYIVYDFMENYYYHSKEWDEIYATGGSTELFRRMYKDVDVVMDMPALYFWKEIHEAFPDVKVILTIRDQEEAWVESLARQMESVNNNKMYTFAKTFTPTGRRMTKTIQNSRKEAVSLTRFWLHKTAKLDCVQFGANMPYSWSPHRVNKTVLKIKYRQHNADVLKNAPKDKLLVFRVQEGWEPLCKFLGVDDPDIPFPHKNVKSSLLKDYAEENPLMIKMIFEAKMAMLLLVLLVAILIPTYFIVFGT